MRALLIDPINKTVTETDCNPSNLTEIYKLIRADCFDIATIRRSLQTTKTVNYREMIFVDDMGLLKDSNHFFRIQGYSQYLAGYGLVMGCDEQGNTVATKLQPKDLIISWYGQLERVDK